MALYQCTSYQPRKRVFSHGAIDQLLVVTGLRALEAIKLRDSGRRSQANFSGNMVLPGPYSLCRPLDFFDTCGAEFVPPRLRCSRAVLPGPLRLVWHFQSCLRKQNFLDHNCPYLWLVGVVSSSKLFAGVGVDELAVEARLGDGI